MRKRKKGLNMHKISRKINPKVQISPVYSLLLPWSELMHNLPIFFSKQLLDQKQLRIDNFTILWALFSISGWALF